MNRFLTTARAKLAALVAASVALLVSFLQPLHDLLVGHMQRQGLMLNAIGKASDFKVYNDQFFGGMAEQLQQDTTALRSLGFNVVTRALRGDYEYSSFLKKISGLVSRRDTTSTSAATDLAVTMDENVSVKLARKIGPVAQTLDAFRKAAMAFQADFDPNGAQGYSRYLGMMYAKDIEADMLDSSLLATRVFLENANTNSNRYTIAANGTLTTAALAATLALMGDHAAKVKAWVMHSKPYFDLLQYQIAPANNGSDLAFQVIAQALPAALNRPIIVTDSPSLVVTGTPNLYRTIGLVDGAIDLIESENQELISEPVTGLENLIVRMQGEYAYNLGIKGAKWNVSGGGANPTSAALSTSTNWTQVSTSSKDFAGAVCISG